MTFWYLVLAVAVFAALTFAYEGGRIIGILEYRANHFCVEAAR